ncbi:MAG: ImmA/IrrE family metallo-endopeptidase [Hydrotalea sp.]|nr:ImmA/IrrE family metallo-endopeptidase [Hydrotalea sp.]
MADALKKLNINKEKYDNLISGQEHPSLPLAKKIAHQAHIPLVYLGLEKVPDENIEKIVRDFRTIGSNPPPKTSANLYDFVREVDYYQDFYRQYAANRGTAKVLKNFAQGDKNGIVRYMREVLSTNLHGRTKNILKKYINNLESRGVMIIQSQYANGDRQRTLNVKEFRGFALPDDHAPLIAINSNDSPKAQLFTLIHEFCHLLLGQSGICHSGLEHKTEDYMAIERFCNDVAAEFLVPTQSPIFEKSWEEVRKEYYKKDFVDEYNVSLLVLARRFYTIGKIDWHEYHQFYEDSYQRYYEAKKLEKEKSRQKIEAKKQEALARGEQPAGFAVAVSHKARLGGLLYDYLRSLYLQDEIDYAKINNVFHIPAWDAFFRNNPYKDAPTEQE